MTTNVLEHLQWDSDFFGYKVARFIFDENGLSKYYHIIDEIKETNVRLTYLYSPPSARELNERIVSSGGVLVDKKTIFVKSTEKHTTFYNRISEWQESEPGHKLVNLALNAGIYSRFFLDKKFSNNEYERLYTKWLLKSVSGELALKTIIARNESEITGFITLGKNNMRADIGLISVDPLFRGKGIGSDLVKYADNLSLNMGFDQIGVVTQLDNVNACKLYTNCGFKIESITDVYHLWLY
ncbi:MAG TPA: GNAT family N-acetyltransferase [Bacteroidales bacterium]|jgi:ribosomal protein S18 acetylase RimI-like enzyme|nr:GNAT family N-acetyltransferase [Bacteroidales bacterium]